ncbi:MAG: AraC family transcriptional regulator [Paracoccaceae bacterium]
MPLTQTSLPLRTHVLFRTTDLDEARARVAEKFCPHRLDTANRAPFLARHHHLAGQALSLNYIEYGAPTRIMPGELGGFYLVQIPLEGGASIRNGNRSYLSTPQTAAVLNPHLPTVMDWAEGTRQLLVQISRQAMQAHLERALGAASDRTLTFDGPLDLTRGPGAALRRLVLWLAAEADQDDGALGSGLMARQIENSVLSGLLDAAAHDHAALLGRLRAAPRPRHLRLAEGFIEANLDQPITLDQVADAAGISPRGLQLAFRQYRGTTPLAHWRDARLDRAHADLMRGEPGLTVTQVALRWGFTHFGRFSELYRARFGLCPRDSLRAGLSARD